MRSDTRAEGDLEIVHEVTMVEVPRGRDGHEVLRFQFVKARTADGKDIAWHSLRVFWRDDSGVWRPGKQGVTIRGRELHAIAAGFAKATQGGAAAQARETTRPAARSARHREVDGRIPPAPAPPWDGVGQEPAPDDDGVF